MRGLLLTLIPLLCLGTASARAGDLDVHYLVDARAIRSLGPSDVLTFELYRDAACRVPLHVERLAALRVGVSLTEVHPASTHYAGATRAATLQAVLDLPAGVHRAFLRVRGRAVRPIGGACQPQAVGL